MTIDKLITKFELDFRLSKSLVAEGSSLIPACILDSDAAAQRRNFTKPWQPMEFSRNYTNKSVNEFYWNFLAKMNLNRRKRDPVPALFFINTITVIIIIISLLNMLHFLHCDLLAESIWFQLIPFFNTLFISFACACFTISLRLFIVCDCVFQQYQN